jgi:hypothetical protein
MGELFACASWCRHYTHSCILLAPPCHLQSSIAAIYSYSINNYALTSLRQSAALFLPTRTLTPARSSAQLADPDILLAWRHHRHRRQHVEQHSRLCRRAMAQWQLRTSKRCIGMPGKWCQPAATVRAYFLRQLRTQKVYEGKHMGSSSCLQLSSSDGDIRPTACAKASCARQAQ